ncbi:MAG: flotillin-like FloA family protein [Bacteroidales bacterium]|nr:flotillin-like FloA family protein [Bacteroidales bacterium]
MKLKYILIILSVLAIMLTYSCKSDKNNNQEYQTDGIEEINFEEDDVTSEPNGMGTGMLILLIVSAIVLGPGLILFFYYFVPIGLWYEAWLSGVKVSWLTLIVMRWQRVPQDLILKTLIKSENAGLHIGARDLSDHYLAEVDIEKVVNTLIRATNAGLEIPLNDLASQYLAKVDVEKVIHAQITAKNADLEIPLKTLASHYLAQVDVETVVDALITAHNSGYDEMTLNDLKEHFLSNGDVKKVVNAFISARKAELPNFTFKDIAAIDLAGIDVVKAIEASITPRVVETDGVTGIAKNGVQLTMKLKITLRAHIKTIIGGASEETVLARVNESLASEIGSSETHHHILKSPYELADRVEQKNLGFGTAFEILSIDVSDIQVGRDIGAELAIERAKANAEMAKADVIRADEKVRKAMAAAFTDGNLSIHDFHNIMNTEADTKMRDSIGNSAMKNKSKQKNEDDENENHD